MTNESKRQQKSGSGDSESTPKTSAITASIGTESAGGSVRLKSLVSEGCFHPNTQVEIPKAGKSFEVAQWQAEDLISRGFAEAFKEGE